MSAKRENHTPDSVYARIRDGKPMFPAAVSVEGKRMIFVSGQLAWDKDGNTVGKGDMRAQFEQVGHRTSRIRWKPLGHRWKTL
jgi:2-iminobutanoate/2-iminopropanoate deaminase